MSLIKVLKHRMSNCPAVMKDLDAAIRKMMTMVDSISPKLWYYPSNTGNTRLVLKNVLKDLLVDIEYEAGAMGVMLPDIEKEEVELQSVKEELNRLKRRMAENEARYKELLDAARASSLRGAELERENELLKDELVENEARYKVELRGFSAAQVAYTEHAVELERENELLNEQITTQALWEEPVEEERATAYEWKSPQGISFCLDNANMYGAGRGALWYFDEKNDKWMVACWVGEDQDIKQVYRKEMEIETSRVEFLEKELRVANEAVRTRENMLLMMNEYHTY